MTLALSKVQKTLNIIFGIIDRSQSIPFLKGLFCWDPLYSNRIRGWVGGNVFEFFILTSNLGLSFWASNPLWINWEKETNKTNKKKTTEAWFQHSKYFSKERLDYLLWDYSLKEVLIRNSYIRRDYAKCCARAQHLQRKICTEKEIEAQKNQRTSQGHLTSEWWGWGSEKGLSDSRLSSFFNMNQEPVL